MAKFAAFHDTRNLYIEYTGYTKPLSYEEWAEKPDSLKAAFLFVQFYNEITLAWSKADSLDFGDDAEGVSTVLQYLDKQVKQTQYFRKDDPSKKASAAYLKSNPDDCIQVERRIIDENPEKFSASYIYKIAYNCLYCICGHDRKCDKDRIENETSAIVMYDGEEFDIFDTYADKKGSAEDCYEASALENEFWSVVRSAGRPAEKVMRYLLTGNKADLKSITARSKTYSVDPLRDVNVSLDEVDEIIAILQKKFLELPEDSICRDYLSSFSTVKMQLA